MKHTAFHSCRLAMVLLLISLSLSANALKLIGTRVVDLSGEIHQLGMHGTVLKPVVVAFVSPNCSVESKSLNAISERAIKQGYAFYGIVPAGLTWQQAKRFSQQKAYQFPVILDADSNLLTELAPSKISEVMVISRFDDMLHKHGKPGSTRIRKLLGELANEHAATVDTACEISAPEIPAEVTYNEHIAPMLQSNCVECHRPNGIAPFHLIGYQQARKFAPVIELVTAQKIMPPWKATPDSGHYLNERVLSDLQIKLLGKWAKGGALEGPKAAEVPPAKIDSSEWRLGKPDMIISMPDAFDIPASGPDIYRYFVMKNAIPKDLEISAIDFKPGDASVVHHSNFFVDYGGRARKKDAEDDEVGFSVFGTGGFFSYWDRDNTAAGLGAWAPGGNPIKYPDGMGIQLPGGADFVFEIHYHPTGKKTQDKSRLAIYLAEKPIKKPVSSLFMGTNSMNIEPGEKDHKRHFWMVLPNEMQLVDVAPHMHYLGTHANVVATLPSGEKKTLLDAVWDFRWQGAYYYREPLTLPKGTRIDAVFSYDNSLTNPYNPYNPPVKATWGWGTDQEMGELYLTVMAKNQRALNALKTSSMASWTRPSEISLATADLSSEEVIEQLRHLSTWGGRGETLLMMLVDSEKRVKEVKKLLKKLVKANPKDASYLVVRGSFAGAQAEFASSMGKYLLYGQLESDYKEALQIDPENWDARYGLAIGYAQEKDADYQKLAFKHFQKLIEQQEALSPQKSNHALAYIGFGELLKANGQLSRAVKVWQRGLSFHPHHVKLGTLVSTKFESAATKKSEAH